MDGEGGARPIFREVVTLEDVEHLQERRAAGADRRHRDDVIPAVLSGEWRAFLGFVVLEILFRDETAVRLHLLGEKSRGRSLVETARPAFGDALERIRE